MRASVIVPTHNRPSQLWDALYCLAAQSSDVHEVIVCDDESSLPLDGVLNRFSGVLPLRYVRQEDLGFRAGAARNLGIRQAAGDLLIFIDDDVR
jgi:glycosyltransferase involved in cell wall biosynthesis